MSVAQQTIAAISDRLGISVTGLDAAQLAARLNGELSRGNDLGLLDIFQNFSRFSEEFVDAVNSQGQQAVGAAINTLINDRPDLFKPGDNGNGGDTPGTIDGLQGYTLAQAAAATDRPYAYVLQDSAIGNAKVYVFNIDVDPNGAFARFGEVTITAYNQSQGDKILFVDQLNQWQAGAVLQNEVQPLAGNAKIIFNPHVDDATLVHSIQIMGASTPQPPFGLTVHDILGVDFAFATATELQTQGLANYVTDLFA